MIGRTIAARAVLMMLCQTPSYRQSSVVPDSGTQKTTEPVVASLETDVLAGASINTVTVNLAAVLAHSL